MDVHRLIVTITNDLRINTVFIHKSDTTLTDICDCALLHKEKAEAVVSNFRDAESDSFSGRLHDSGYNAKHYPWDDARVKACMEALLIE